MKLIASTIVLAGIAVLLAVTNPKLESYKQFVQQQIKTETGKQENSWVNAIGALFGGIASNLVIQQTVRRDLVFFSLYDTQIGDEHLKAVGVFNNFFITDKPSFFKKAPNSAG